MPEPSEKSPKIEEFLEENFGRTTAIKNSRCIPPPVGCGKVVTMEVDPEWPNKPHAWAQTWFRDEISMKEYSISGLCQACQDLVWGPDAE